MQRVLVACIALLLLVGCEEGFKTGTHFQGRDCQLCHNTQLTSDKALAIGGSLYVSKGSQPDEAPKMCNQSVFFQFIDNTDNSVLFDSRNSYEGVESGYRGRGNFFLLAKDGKVPTSSAIMRLLLEDNTTLAVSSGTHTFSDTFNALDGADSNNRYSCNACHSVDPQGAAPSVITLQRNAGLCLDSYEDVSANIYFANDVFPRMFDNCYSCHSASSGNTNAYNAFEIVLDDYSQTQDNIVINSLISRETPENSRLLNCPDNSDHNTKNQCIKQTSEYNRTLNWIKLYKRDEP